MIKTMKQIIVESMTEGRGTKDIERYKNRLIY